MTSIFKGRAVDVSSGDVVYTAQTSCPDCPTVGLMGRLVDVLNIGGIAWEVYTVVPECQKDWDEEVEYVSHDTGSGGPAVVLSREIKLQFNQMEECTTDNSACPYITLIYDVARNMWTGSIALDTGVAEFEFYGVWNGVDNIDWKLGYYGCADMGTGSNVAIITVVCTGVGKWTAIGGSPLINCCDGDPIPSQIVLTGKMNPIVRGREVDVLSGFKVYAINECCPDECQESPGCCFGERIDENIDYTGFNVVNNTGGCACASPTFTPTDSSGCAIMTWGSDARCTGPVSVCLSCQPTGTGTTQHGWQFYRLIWGGNSYAPSSGSCDPLSVTFDNLPWTTASPMGACSGTLSVTVTR